MHMGQKLSDSFQCHDLKGVLVKHMCTETATAAYMKSSSLTFNIEVGSGLDLVAGAGVLAHVLGHWLGHGQLVDGG